MHIVTHYVHPDEPCFGLREGPRMVQVFPRGQEWHWVQQIFILRDDCIAKYEQDFGDADNFLDIQPLVLVCDGQDDTVGEAQEEATKNRHDTYWAKRARELQDSSTLIEDHIKQIEMVKTYAKRNPRTTKEITRAN